MKYVWEASDIRAGLIVTREGGDHFVVIEDKSKFLYALVSLRTAVVALDFAPDGEVAQALTESSAAPTDYTDTLEEMAKASLG